MTGITGKSQRERERELNSETCCIFYMSAVRLDYMSTTNKNHSKEKMFHLLTTHTGFLLTINHNFNVVFT